MLRKRSARPELSTATSASRHGDNDSSHGKKHSAHHRYYPFIYKVMLVVVAVFLLFISYNLGRNAGLGDSGVINLEKISTITTVPLGFTIDIPQDLGASLEVYLDDRLVSSIDNLTSQSTQKFYFGTCDISDHGDNVRGHAFSLGDGELGNLNILFLKPGNHIIKVQQRHDKQQLTPYAQKIISVRSPPELILQSSSSSSYENAYKLALEEMGRCIACDNFVAGTGWSQLWTRDTSFASELGAALLNPLVVKKSLMASTTTLEDGKKVWLQDKCGHFGGWPNLSDAIVGTRGSWSLYLVTGDKEFLKWAYAVTKDSLERAEREVLDKDSGLFMGCSSFLESNSGYPEKYMNDGKLVGKTKALSTNMLYYSGYKLGAMMGKELGMKGKEIHDLEEKANLLKATIQKRLWSPSKNSYAYFEDEYGMLVDTTEGLGISLALLEFEDDERNAAMLKSTHTTEFGITCIWPQFKYSPSFFEWRIPRHYHNGRIWPFVQGYWAMAAAQHKQVDLFSHELKGLTALSQKGNTFAEFYQLNGTFPEERRSQLWSATGYISMIYHGVFGIRIELGGIRFSPMKPADLFAQTIHLNNIHYRGMILNIHLHGVGTTVASFELNHKKQREPFIQSDQRGYFDIDINLYP